MKQSLLGQRIVVTRPAHQAEPLCALIQRLGGIVLRLPTLEIKAYTPANSVMLRMIDSDCFIFSSVNAVRYGLPLLRLSRLHMPSLFCMAIGQQTQKGLLQAGLKAISPPSPFNSEALLTLPNLASVQAHVITLVKGVGGRALLSTTLTERGAHVVELPVYQRCVPEVVNGANILAIQQGQVDHILISSQQSLEHLVHMVGLAPLRSSHLLVGSQRQADYAQTLGCCNVVSLISPCDEAYVAQLRRSTEALKTSTLGAPE